MDKKLILLSAALCLACQAYAGDKRESGGKEGTAKEAASAKRRLPPPGSSLSVSASTIPVSELDLKPGAPPPVTLLKKEGKTDQTAKYKVTIPKNGRFRVLWKSAPSSKTEKMKFKIELTSPSDKKYLQGITKELKYEEEETSGAIFDCLVVGGEVNIALETVHASWEFEVQLLK